MTATDQRIAPLVVALVCLAGAEPSRAGPHAPSYSVEVFGVDEGLPVAVVHAVACGPGSAVWATTFDGLVRLLDGMTEEAYARVRSRLLSIEPGAFCESEGDGTQAAVDSLRATMERAAASQPAYPAAYGQPDAR